MGRFILIGVFFINSSYSKLLVAEEESDLSCEEFKHIMEVKFNDKTVKCDIETNKDNPENKISSNCSCDNVGGLNCVYTLTGYKKGKFTHKKDEEFTQTILSEIQQFKDIEVFNVKIKGVADGTRNKGIGSWKKIIPECNKGKKGKKGSITDKDLSYLRACYIMNEINSFIPITWKNSSLIRLSSIDYPDGVNVGSEYRKIEFRYSVLGKCDE